MPGWAGTREGGDARDHVKVGGGRLQDEVRVIAAGEGVDAQPPEVTVNAYARAVVDRIAETRAVADVAVLPRPRERLETEVGDRHNVGCALEPFELCDLPSAAFRVLHADGVAAPRLKPNRRGVNVQTVQPGYLRAQLDAVQRQVKHVVGSLDQPIATGLFDDQVACEQRLEVVEHAKPVRRVGRIDRIAQIVPTVKDVGSTRAEARVKGEVGL
jgi:hypothetical protein